MEELGLKPYNSKYLKNNEHTKHAKFYWTKKSELI